jgi:hypothetical protein
MNRKLQPQIAASVNMVGSQARTGGLSGVVKVLTPDILQYAEDIFRFWPEIGQDLTVDSTALPSVPGGKEGWTPCPTST